MLRKQSNDIHWLEFEILQEHPIKHAVFLRHGGASSNPFQSLNLGDNVGDNPENIQQNLDRIKQCLSLSSITYANQPHGEDVLEVKNHSQSFTCDGLTTSQTNLPLMVKHADCQAAIFYDPVHHALSVVHAGWRGSVQNIYKNAIEKMAKLYGSRPNDLLVGISPSLGPDDAQFVNYRTELPESFWEFQSKPNYFDFWEISKMQLMESGVFADHIEIAGISTASNPRDYFSYRRENRTGRHGTVAALI